jgi:putative transcriptional regulator
VAKKPLSRLEQDLVDGLRDFARDLKTDAPLAPKYTCTRVSLDLEPTEYGAAKVVATRKLLSLSQVLFAKFLGVSPKTVRAWEQGKQPSEMACRFMDEIQRNPEYWRKIVKDATRVKKVVR